MSLVEVKCPRCGSPSNLQRGNTNEYACSACGAVFRFVDTTKREVTKGILVRSCLYCGKPIVDGRGFKCTHCGQEFFCDACVDESIQGKYVCASCLIALEQNCHYCKKYADYRCIDCGKVACKCTDKSFIKRTVNALPAYILFFAVGILVVARFY